MVGRGWVVGWLLSSFGISCAWGRAEASLGGRAGKSCMSTFLPGLACLSCWSSAGEIKPRLRLSHCGLEEVMSGEDIGPEQTCSQRDSSCKDRRRTPTVATFSPPQLTSDAISQRSTSVYNHHNPLSSGPIRPDSSMYSYGTKQYDYQPSLTRFKIIVLDAGICRSTEHPREQTGLTLARCKGLNPHMKTQARSPVH